MTMKNYLLFFCFVALSITELNGQNLPFRFNPKFKINNLTSVADSQSKSSVKDFYMDMYNRTLEIATKKEKSVLSGFQQKKKLCVEKLNDKSDLMEIKKIQSELDYIEQHEKEEINSINEIKKIAQQYRYKAINSGIITLFPVRNSIHAQLFYNSQLTSNAYQILKNSNIIYSPDGEKVSVMNEIYADYFGPFRVGFGVLISNNNVKSPVDTSSSQQDAIQRLLGGGGNAIGGVGFPLLNCSNASGQFNIKMAFSPKLSVDVPILGTETGKYAVNSDVGVDGALFYTGTLNTLTFYINSRIGYVFGNSTFYDNLIKDDKKGFFFNQVSVGLAINSTFRIAWTNYFGDTFVKDHFTSVVSFSIIPN